MADDPTSPPESGSPESGVDQNPVSVREQDRFLPIANISRIMKKAIPSNGKIAKDAKEIVQECVSEFISFVTSEYDDILSNLPLFLFIYMCVCFSFHIVGYRLLEINRMICLLVA